MKTSNRFVICLNCVSPIDTIMDIYYGELEKGKTNELLIPIRPYCAHCANHYPHIAAKTKMVVTEAAQSINKQFKTELDEIEIAPRGTVFICDICRKLAHSRSVLKTVCDNPSHLRPVLIWVYSIVTDNERGIVQDYIPYLPKAN